MHGSGTSANKELLLCIHLLLKAKASGDKSLFLFYAGSLFLCQKT